MVYLKVINTLIQNLDTKPLKNCSYFLFENVWTQNDLFSFRVIYLWIFYVQKTLKCVAVTEWLNQPIDSITELTKHKVIWGFVDLMITYKTWNKIFLQNDFCFVFVTFCQSTETPLPTEYDDDAIMKIAKIQMYVQYVVVFTWL